MKRFIEGADRGQSTLLPDCLDDWVDESNPVRAVDAFVDALDLTELGFADVEPAATGRPRYHPSPLLKLYIYGYLNRIQSSRRLEREASRNLEVIWLLQRLTPDDKTIADFRKDNGAAIKKVCAKFVELCRQMGLLTKASVAIDGSKFKAVNTRDKNFTKGKVERRRQQLEESVSRYLAQLDTADLQEPSETLAAKTAHLKEKLARLAAEMQKLEAYENAMLASSDQQISLTDPDCRSMATSGRGSGVVGYNVQVAVDTEHHLIIVHEVTNSGTDRAQLAKWALRRKRCSASTSSRRWPIAATTAARRLRLAATPGSRSRCRNRTRRAWRRRGSSASMTSLTWPSRISIAARLANCWHIGSRRWMENAPSGVTPRKLVEAANSRLAAPRPRTASSPVGSTSTSWRLPRSGSTPTPRRCGAVARRSSIRLAH